MAIWRPPIRYAMREFRVLSHYCFCAWDIPILINIHILQSWGYVVILFGWSLADTLMWQWCK
jgi:hypothetical protein